MKFDEKLKNFLDENGRLKQWPKKGKLKMVVLNNIAELFKKENIYNEKEIDDIIEKHHTFNDSCMLRRELVNKGFLERKRDGSEYWLVSYTPNKEDYSPIET